MHIVAVIGSYRNAFAGMVGPILAFVAYVELENATLTISVFISGSEGDLSWRYLAENAD